MLRNPSLALGRPDGTCVVQPTFRWSMDDKTLNLWRQIEGARRLTRRSIAAAGGSRRQSRPEPDPAS